ncbi:MAG: hypothetical protein PHR06_13635, partial [Candidatus Cloacimonetes bacterium]|nr:hypothetical protein [Candidatus Cloacimonadota bacterium]
INCIPSNVITFFTPVIDFFSTIFTMNKITDMATDPAVQSFYGGVSNPASQFLMYGYPDSIKTDPVKQKKYLQSLYK